MLLLMPTIFSLTLTFVCVVYVSDIIECVFECVFESVRVARSVCVWWSDLKNGVSPLELVNYADRFLFVFN